MPVTASAASAAAAGEAAARSAGDDARTAGVVLLAALLYVFGVLLRFLWAGPPAARPAGWAAATMPGYGAVAGAAGPAGAATYEDLLALGDALGDVSSGLSPAQIAVFPTHSHRDPPPPAAGPPAARPGCAVCLEYFRPGDLLQTLPCAETFHKECIGRWLRQKPTCPLCRSRFA